jgi:hypothetical protein
MHPYLVIYQIRQALKNEDSAALAAYVDFPSVRQGIKDQLNTELVKKFPEHARHPRVALPLSVPAGFFDD